MTYKLRFHTNAFIEVHQAADHYEDEREGLGTEFLDCVGATLIRIQEAPNAFSLYPGLSSVRRALVERFPYGIVFMLKENTVRVISIYHNRRKPGFWIHRLKNNQYF